MNGLERGVNCNKSMHVMIRKEHVTKMWTYPPSKINYLLINEPTRILLHASSLPRMEDLYLSEKRRRSPDEASWPQVKSHEGWTAESRHSQGWTSQMLPNSCCLCSGGWK